MKEIRDKIFDAERALYGSTQLSLVNCSFDGEADGESALKECSDISVESCLFNLRYPLWHNNGLTISSCDMTSLCRAPLWYSNSIEIKNTRMHGVKALRECSDIAIHNCEIVSPEFGWSSKNIELEDTAAQGEYFMLRAQELNTRNLRFTGKYSFQYIKNAVFKDCTFDTKDAFWHAENVTAEDCVIKGEYLAWYSKNLTLIHCRISGTQPFCYCENLRLIECELTDADLCFEKSSVEASITTHVVSIKNPLSGVITVPSVGEIIMDDENAKGKIVTAEQSAS